MGFEAGELDPANSLSAFLDHIPMRLRRKGKTILPKAASEVTLMSAGKVLENTKTVGQCKMPSGDVGGGGILMYVVVQSSLARKRRRGETGWFPKESLKSSPSDQQSLPSPWACWSALAPAYTCGLLRIVYVCITTLSLGISADHSVIVFGCVQVDSANHVYIYSKMLLYHQYLFANFGWQVHPMALNE